MKNLLKLACGATILALAFASVSCNDDDRETISSTVPTAQEFDHIRLDAIESRVQNFTFDGADGYVNFTSAQGITIGFDASCLEKNGAPVSGSVTLQYVEIFGGGDMAVTNKPTMGRMPNGDRAMLLSGGQFYLQAYQDGEKLDINCGLSLIVPIALTNSADVTMALWVENVNSVADTLAVADVDWTEADPNPNGQNGVFREGNNYYVNFGEFGWTNVDCFAVDPNPKTTILADVPSGYHNENSSVYLSYDGRGNALALLDTYDAATGLFSEHYGQIPIGLACHAIFVTEENGMFRYAIKAVTISEDLVITFSNSETTLGTEAQLVAAINAVQE